MSKDITFRDTFDVQLVDSYGSDELICQAARVSTLGAAAIESEEKYGLINFLMKNRHGSPFEHSGMTFLISAPIFVWREFMRHRIGFSYNEQSGRYMELEPVFYRPNQNRPIVQIGKPGHYEYIPGSDEQHKSMSGYLAYAYREAWESYRVMLSQDIAKEVARMCLPVSIYSTAYVTLNPRSMMNFLTLRTKNENAFFPSYPMDEIAVVAGKMEEIFKVKFPLTHNAFTANRRIAP